MPYTHPNSTPTRGGGKTNRWVHAQGHLSVPLDFPGTVVMPATAKAIHKMGWHASKAVSHRQPLQPSTTPPKKDKKENKHAQVSVHRRRGNRPQEWDWTDRVAHLRHGGGQQHLAQALLPPHLMPKPDQPSPWSQSLSQSYGPQEALT
jgi:hypothetical protein